MKTKVYIIESEAGWGSTVDEVIEFDSKEEAIKYCTEYNDKYNPPIDNPLNWYMWACLEGEQFMRRSKEDVWV